MYKKSPTKRNFNIKYLPDSFYIKLDTKIAHGRESKLYFAIKLNNKKYALDISR